MNKELDGRRSPSEPRREVEDSAELRAKAQSYALVNRPSPPF